MGSSEFTQHTKTAVGIQRFHSHDTLNILGTLIIKGRYYGVAARGNVCRQSHVHIQRDEPWSELLREA